MNSFTFSLEQAISFPLVHLHNSDLDKIKDLFAHYAEEYTVSQLPLNNVKDGVN